MDIDHSYGFGAALLDFFLPRRCTVCDAVLDPSETLLCENCWSDLPHTYSWLLRKNPMADRFNAQIQERLDEEWCMDLQSEERLTDADATAEDLHACHGVEAVRTERYAYAAALFFYRTDSVYSRITRCIKYQGRLEVGRHFGRMLGDKLAGSCLFADVDAVVPVPLHWARKWKRGYNQAEVIASGVADRLGVQMRSDILIRRRRTRTQTKLSIKEKRRNVSGAFAVHKQFRLEASPYRHILIIDDVFTTGSTLHACFSALRTVFPPEVRISVATLAFVGGT